MAGHRLEPVRHTGSSKGYRTNARHHLNIRRDPDHTGRDLRHHRHQQSGLCRQLLVRLQHLGRTRIVHRTLAWDLRPETLDLVRAWPPPDTGPLVSESDNDHSRRIGRDGGPGQCA